MAKLGAFPFVPNMDDCKMVVQANGAVCYIMDTHCRNMTREDKARADQEIVDIYLRAAMRRKAKGSA
ncbi:hypothetical protein [Oscillibacter sp.]|uniref:hypothetical protein n=1 Tax=Oscillibacter sp. TaxID=1945593 RepID=UPI003397742E